MLFGARPLEEFFDERFCLRSKVWREELRPVRINALQCFVSVAAFALSPPVMGNTEERALMGDMYRNHA